MNKKAWVILVILSLLTMPVLAGYGLKAGGGRTIHVYPMPGASPIQDAINSASPGDTILVHNGTYHENVIIDRGLSLVGDDPNSTVIDGNWTGSAILIVANNVNVSSFTIMNGGPQTFDCGISVVDSSNVNISNNVVTSNNDGIDLQDAFNCTVSNNTIHSNNNDGIGAYYSSNNTIVGNILYMNEMHGINLKHSSTNIVRSNILRSNDYIGMIVQYSSDNTVSQNVVSLSRNGIAFHYCSGNALSGNTITLCSQGVRFYGSSYNVVTGNSIASNALGLSFLTSDSSDNVVYHNNFGSNLLDARSVSANFWDSQGEGNRWGEYTERDSDADGIGDVPYSLDAINEDRYPLMGAFTQSDVNLGDILYFLTAISNSSVAQMEYTNATETGDKILRFNVTADSGSIAFCRIMIPIELMEPPYIILCDGEEIIQRTLASPNQTYVRLYLLYSGGSHTIAIISPEFMRSYEDLLAKYNELQAEFSALNETYDAMLLSYNDLLNDKKELEEAFADLNTTYYGFLGNYSQLQSELERFNQSDQEHERAYLGQVQNTRSLGYVFAVAAAILIVSLVCLSKSVRVGPAKKIADSKSIMDNRLGSTARAESELPL